MSQSPSEVSHSDRIRSELIEQFANLPPPNPADVAALASEGSVFMQILGLLYRENLQMGTMLLGVDLVTQEGHLRALRDQGRVLGYTQLFERVLELVINGVPDEDVSPE